MTVAGTGRLTLVSVTGTLNLEERRKISVFIFSWSGILANLPF